MPAVKNRSKKQKPKKTPRTYKPDDMSLEQWQTALRREFGREQKFRLVNVGSGEVFSDFNVTNPQTRRTYRVTIRGTGAGDNHCTCPDFAVNTLGTCKHIEFTLSRLERRPGGKAPLLRGYRPAFSEIWLRYGARREVVLRRGSDFPADPIGIDPSWLDSDDTLLEDAVDRFDEFLAVLRQHGHEVRCHEDALELVAQRRDLRRLRERVDELFPAAERSESFKTLLKVSLYPYQRQGALFIARAGRALLADEMGLGKTIQALAAVEILARAVGIARVLIVCPTSLKHQWRQEIEKFTDRSATVIEGGIPLRSAKFADDSFFKIVNYDVLKVDTPHIEQWSPDLIILDEAQRIKNWKTRTAQTVKQLQSQYAIVLTGTPLENRLEELHSIVEFVDRFRLGPSFRFLYEHQQFDEDGRVVGYRNLGSIARTLEPILLRRTKQDVLKDLPPRIEKLHLIPMTRQQMEYHEANRAIVARIVARWRKTKYLSESDQRRLTAALQNMRMSCNSTYLLDPASEHGTKADELVGQLCEVLESQPAKAVIFSQWIRSHELLARRLKERAIGHVLFHGGVPGPARKDLVGRFKQETDCRVFLSTDAGGVGLNLQNASAVFNMDIPWNPAVLEQRIGRVHRMGQSQPVHVMNFVSEGTIEHGMLDLLKFKKSLFAGALDGGADEVFLGGTRLNRFMQSVESATSHIPEAPPTPAAPAEPEEAVAAMESAVDRLISTSQPTSDVWSQLISAGKTALDSLAVALSNENGKPQPNANGFAVERNPSTGQTYLKLPVPSPEVVGRAVVWLQAIVGALQPPGIK
jgi:superfamily II DNA or RNA helicase